MPDNNVRSLADLQAELGGSRLQKSEPTAELVTLANVTPRPIEWLWPERIAQGKVSIIAGDPGLGKSILTLDIAAKVSCGGKWPVHQDSAAVGDAVLMSAEDDLEDTIRPRLDAVNADVSRIHALTMIREIDPVTGKLRRRPFSLAADIERLEEAIQSLPKCRLVIIDPISAYLGGTDSHNNADVRALLTPLADLAQRCGAAVVAVTHLNKSSGNAIYRAMGSIAFVAAARAVYVVAKDPDDSSRRIMMPSKNNLGEDQAGFAYKVACSGLGAPYIDWESDPVYEDIDILMARSDGGSEKGSAREDAKHFLEDLLIDGPVRAKQVLNDARNAGVAERTLRRAKDSLGIEAIKTSFGGPWAWALPEHVSEDDQKYRRRPPSGNGRLGKSWPSSSVKAALESAANAASQETGFAVTAQNLLDDLAPVDLNDDELMKLDRLIPYAKDLAKRLNSNG